MGKLIQDGNQVYEIDEECIREKEQMERDRQTEKKERREEYGKNTGKNMRDDRIGNRFSVRR